MELNASLSLVRPEVILSFSALGLLLVAAWREQAARLISILAVAALTAAEIEAYVATGEPLACAGGFALEGRGGLVVERLEGCYSNVIGLSLPLLRRWLKP